MNDHLDNLCAGRDFEHTIHALDWEICTSLALMAEGCPPSSVPVQRAALINQDVG